MRICDRRTYTLGCVFTLLALSACAKSSQGIESMEEKTVDHGTETHAAAKDVIAASLLESRIMEFADGVHDAKDTMPERYEQIFKLALAADDQVPRFLKGSGSVVEGYQYFLQLKPHPDDPIFGYVGELRFPVEYWEDRMHEAKSCSIPMHTLVDLFRSHGYEMSEIQGSTKFKGGWSASKTMADTKMVFGIGIYESFVYDKRGSLVETCVSRISFSYGPVEQ
jgi:hypothetical protein